MPNAQTRLLIVDDEPLIRSTMSHALTDLGYHTRSAEDGFSALREIRQQMPDILLSDLNMPGMSGFELLSVVRRRFPAVHSIAMSGAFSGDEVPSGVAADAFYQKGSSMGALLQMIGTLTQMERRAARPMSMADTIWVQRSGHNADGEAYVTIACPECLRTFTQAVDGSIFQVHGAVCIHCCNPIQYAIVEPVNGLPLQAYRQRPAEGKTVLISAAKFIY
jgi:CheY-like chemotaxis protein